MTTLHISRTREPGGVTNPSGLVAAYDWNGEEGVRDLMRVMTAAYPLGPAGNVQSTSPQVGKAVVILLASNEGIDFSRLGFAISTFGAPGDVIAASPKSTFRAGKGAAVHTAATIASRYNSSDTRKGMTPLGDLKKLVVKPIPKLAAVSAEGELAEPEEAMHPWQDARSKYAVSITEMRVGDIVPAPSNRDPATRRRFLQNQGPWLEALQQVPDVVRITKRGKDTFLAVDGGGRIYKKVSIDNDPDYVMPVRLHENVGNMQSVHDLFVALNQTRKAVLPIELFLGALAVKAPDETAISEVLGEFALPE